MLYFLVLSVLLAVVAWNVQVVLSEAMVLKQVLSTIACNANTTNHGRDTFIAQNLHADFIGIQGTRTPIRHGLNVTQERCEKYFQVNFPYKKSKMTNDCCGCMLLSKISPHHIEEIKFPVGKYAALQGRAGLVHYKGWNFDYCIIVAYFLWKTISICPRTLPHC